MNKSSFAELFKFISHHDIRSVDIISDYLSTNNSSDDGPRMNSYSHIQIIEIQSLSDSLDGLHHRQTHIDDIFSLLQIVSLITVGKAKHNIAVSDRVHFINIVFETKFVKLFEELPEHLDDSRGCVPV